MSVTYTLLSESIAISSGCLNLPKPIPSDPHFVTKEYCCPWGEGRIPRYSSKPYRPLRLNHHLSKGMKYDESFDSSGVTHFRL